MWYNDAMETILTILFFVLSVFVTCLILGWIVFVVLAAVMFKIIYDIFIIIKKESDKVAGDIDSVRGAIKNGGEKFRYFILYLVSFFKKPSKKSRKKE